MRALFPVSRERYWSPGLLCRDAGPWDKAQVACKWPGYACGVGWSHADYLQSLCLLGVQYPKLLISQTLTLMWLQGSANPGGVRLRWGTLLCLILSPWLVKHMLSSSSLILGSHRFQVTYTTNHIFLCYYILDFVKGIFKFKSIVIKISRRLIIHLS